MCMKDVLPVSVVIPTYNRFTLLCEAVRSVLGQTSRGFEVIIVDDGSRDGTPGGVARAFPDSRVRCISLDHTGMPGLVRNRVAALSRGKYLAFLDSDDLWLPDKLEKQLHWFRENPGIRICHTRERWVRNGREISQASRKYRRQGMIFEDALTKCIIGPSTVMMERSLFEETGGFRENLEIAEDYEYWLRITPIHNIGYIDQPLTVKQAGHGDQLSEKYGHIEFFRIKGLKDLVDRDWFSRVDAAAVRSARLELSRKSRIYAAGARKRGKTEEAEEYETLAERYA